MTANHHRHLPASSGQQGQAAVEYVLIAVAVCLALATLNAASKLRCAGAEANEPTQCLSVAELIGESFQGSLEDITLLINLPF